MELPGKKVIAVASTSGGAEAISPVILRLRESGDKVHVISGPDAARAFRAMKIEPDKVAPDPDSAASRVSLFRQPGVILTGTSLQSKNGELTLEQLAWRLGSMARMNRVAVLDTWGNYAEPFSDLACEPGAERRITNLFAHIPTTIGVIDGQALAGVFSRVNYDGANIEITGNPYFEHTRAEFEGYGPATREALLAKPVFSGFTKGAKLVVFISNPVDAGIGFTAQSALESFLNAADTLADYPMDINVVVRPHPSIWEDAMAVFKRHDSARFSGVLHNPENGPDPQNEYTLKQLMYSADLVVGTRDMLITALLAGKPVINYAPGLKPPSGFNDFDLYELSAAILTENRSPLHSEVQLSAKMYDMLAGRTVLSPFPTGIRHSTDMVIAQLTRELV